MSHHRMALLTIAAAAVLDIACGLGFAAAEHVSVAAGLYWAVGTATTTGYADVSPKTAPGHFVSVLAMLSVIPLFSAAFSLFTSGLMAAHVSRAEKRLRDHITTTHSGGTMSEAASGRPVMLRAGTVTVEPNAAAVRPMTSSAVTLLADLSEWQPDVADAAYLSWSKAVAVRAMYGDAHDDGAWYRGARRDQFHKLGARFVGIYQFLVAGQDGAAQARAFRSLVGAIRPGEVFVADFEQGTRAMLTAWYDEMLALYGPGIRPYLWTYTGEYFGESTGALPADWIAAYRAAEPSSRHKLWQFSETFPVPGVGTADCSVFHGTIDELAVLAYPAAPPKPQPLPADWVYEPVRGLKLVARGGTSVKLSWSAPAGPAGAPAVAYYEIAASEGPSLTAEAPSYPRFDPKHANPEVWQGGSLTPGKTYTFGVRACPADGGHSSAWVTVTVKAG